LVLLSGSHDLGLSATKSPGYLSPPQTAGSFHPSSPRTTEACSTAKHTSLRIGKVIHLSRHAYTIGPGEPSQTRQSIPTKKSTNTRISLPTWIIYRCTYRCTLFVRHHGCGRVPPRGIKSLQGYRPERRWRREPANSQ